MCVVNIIPRLVGWPQGRSARVRKISPTQGLDLRTVLAIECCYTDYDIPIENVCSMQIIIS